MSKFFENFKERIRNIPSLIAKRLVHISILGDSIDFELPPIMKNQTLKQYLEDLILKVNDVVIFDANTYPFDYNVKLNGKIYLNREVLEIYDKLLKIGDKTGLIVPNRLKLTPGFHKVIIATHSAGMKANFHKYISSTPKSMKTTVSQITKNNRFPKCSYCGKKSSDPNQVICEYCGSELNQA